MPCTTVTTLLQLAACCPAASGVSPDPSAWLTRAEAMDVAGQQQGGGPQSWSGTSPLGSTPTPGRLVGGAVHSRLPTRAN
jgi:hypothetical protein